MAARQVIRVLVALGLLLCASGCAATYHPEFDTYAPRLTTVAIVADERIEWVWARDLRPRLKRASRLDLPDPPDPPASKPGEDPPAAPSSDPVRRGKELGVSAVLELDVTRVHFISGWENLFLASVSFGLATEDSYLEGAARLYDVASGTLLWEVDVEETDDVLSTEILRRCSEQVVDAWPFPRER